MTYVVSAEERFFPVARILERGRKMAKTGEKVIEGDKGGKWGRKGERGKAGARGERGEKGEKRGERGITGERFVTMILILSQTVVLHK